MKYIKLFDSFSEFNFNYELWTLSDNDHKFQLSIENNEPEEINKNDIDDIKNTLGEEYIIWQKIVKRFEYDKIKSCVSLGIGSHLNKRNELIIYKFKDEWWAIELFDLGGPSYSYICDTKEGLINLLKNIISKI